MKLKSHHPDRELKRAKEAIKLAKNTVLGFAAFLAFVQGLLALHLPNHTHPYASKHQNNYYNGSHNTHSLIHMFSFSLLCSFSLAYCGIDFPSAISDAEWALGGFCACVPISRKEERSGKSDGINKHSQNR